MEDILREIRDNSIKQAYFDTMKSIRKRTPYISTDEIVREIMKKTAPRFFISYENARRVISLMDRGEKIKISNKNKQRMYSDMYKAFLNLRKETNIPGYGALKLLLEQEAPSYYVSPYTMRSIVYKSIKTK